METFPGSASKEEGLRLLKSGQVKEAIQALKSVLESDGDDAQVHSYLGVAYHQNNDRLHSVYHMEESLRLHETPSACYNLGLAYEECHRIDEAVRQYRRALALDPNYANAQAAMQKLQEKFLAAQAAVAGVAAPELSQTQAVSDEAQAVPASAHGPSLAPPYGQTAPPSGPPDFLAMQIQKDMEIAEQHRKLMKAGLIYGIICGAIFITLASFASSALMGLMLVAKYGILNFILIVAGIGAVYGGMIGFWVGNTCGGEGAGMQAGAVLGAVFGLTTGLIGRAGVFSIIFMVFYGVISGILGMFIGRMVDSSIGWD